MRKSMRVIFMVAAVAMLAVGANGCSGKKSRVAEAALDTPEHHVMVGERKLAEGDLDEAARSFDLALQLDPKFAPGYVGKGLVHAARKEWPAAEADLKKAMDVARGEDQKVAAYTGMIRLLSEQRKNDDWIKEARDYFEQAVDENKKAPEPYFYMGIAYKRAFQFEEAGDMFRRVLDLNSQKEGSVSASMQQQATNEWRLVQDIQLAAPGSKIGKQIALIDKITRADLAALFVQELNLPKLYSRGGKKFDTSFKSPGSKMETEKMVHMADAVDIDGHVLRTDIQDVIKLGVRGLEPDPEHKFHPNDPVAKAEFAVMLEDILVKITGDADLSTKFIGETSPFPDVRSDAPYFNAIMVASSRQVLGAKDLSTGEFAPKDPVSGALALLAIRKLKDALQY